MSAICLNLRPTVESAGPARLAPAMSNPVISRPAVKTASVEIQSIVVWCPHCGDCLEASLNGSTYLTSEDVVRQALKPGRTVRCESCGERFRLPGGALRALWEAR